MNYVARFACIALPTILVVNAGTAGKPASNEARAITSSPLTSFSEWKPIFLLRDGVFNPSKRKEFNDTLFEYRWRSEWILNRYVCTVEVRHTEDADDSHRVPEIDVVFTNRHHLTRGHSYDAHDVVVGGPGGHVYFKPADCERVEFVYWKK
jgi:hypothetical protein